jgi:uncharacterized protein (DUF2237 family)
MERLNRIFEVLSNSGFSADALQVINSFVNDIQNGREDFSRFNLSEHAGLCKGGPHLIGASVVACYATASITASRNASGSQESPANWEIDAHQEQFIEQWAKAANLWEGQGVNYISDRLALEDMHPANVFIDTLSKKPICIDCIVKFVK